jgi:hypothetical protein
LEHLSRIQEEASLIFKKCFQGGKDWVHTHWSMLSFDI